MTDKKQNLLSIGQFATATMLSQKALRIYDRQNILKPVYTDPETSYRYYHPDQVPIARHIRLLRQIEMPLSDIQNILTADPEDVPAILQAYLQAFEARYKQVRTNIQKLITYLNTKGPEMAYEITKINIAPQQALCIQKNVYVSELVSHIKNSAEAITNTIKAQGGKIASDAFGIYHGPVNKEENGPMEVCIPADGSFTVSGDMVVREISGGTAASLTIDGDDIMFPKILDAYNAIHDWIVTNDYEIAEPPREVWISVPGNAEKIEIVWPYKEQS